MLEDAQRIGMDVVERREEAVVIELTKAELLIVSSAINEISHRPDAIDDWEFHTRIGGSRAEAQALLAVLSQLP